MAKKRPKGGQFLALRAARADEGTGEPSWGKAEKAREEETKEKRERERER